LLLFDDDVEFTNDDWCGILVGFYYFCIFTFLLSLDDGVLNILLLL